MAINDNKSVAILDIRKHTLDIAKLYLGRKGKEVTFSEEDLFNYLRYLYFEISLETVRRNTNIAPAPATLETILTNRDVSWEE